MLEKENHSNKKLEKKLSLRKITLKIFLRTTQQKLE